MSKNELKELLKDNVFGDGHKINASALFNIYSFVNVSLEIDKSSLDCYYEIDIDELLSSKMPNEEYEIIKDQGWSIDGDKLKIFLTI